MVGHGSARRKLMIPHKELTEKINLMPEILFFKSSRAYRDVWDSNLTPGIRCSLINKYLPGLWQLSYSCPVRDTRDAALGIKELCVALRRKTMICSGHFSTTVIFQKRERNSINQMFMQIQVPNLQLLHCACAVKQ